MGRRIQGISLDIADLFVCHFGMTSRQKPGLIVGDSFKGAVNYLTGLRCNMLTYERRAWDTGVDEAHSTVALLLICPSKPAE